MEPNFIVSHFEFQTYDELIEGLYIRAILDSYSRLSLQADLPELTENKIRNRLIYDLEHKNPILKGFFENNLLKFSAENTLVSEDDSTVRTDIEFFLFIEGTFIIECKKLSSYSQAYILEGVHRFVTKQYAAKANQAAMLAFMVKGNIDKVCHKTKKKVLAEESCLQHPRVDLLCSEHRHSFHSLHNRVDTEHILLHHVFLDFTAPPPPDTDHLARKTR